MPHWHIRAHELASGGSPGSQPAPVRPGDLPGGTPRRVWYAPTLERLARQSESAVPVAVLDTGSICQYARRADKLGNDQLRETVEWLTQHSQDGAHLADEWREVGQHHAEFVANAGELKTYHMADHGLFIAGLIHGAAPGAPIRYEPVLNETASVTCRCCCGRCSASWRRRTLTTRRSSISVSVSDRTRPACRRRGTDCLGLATMSTHR